LIKVRAKHIPLKQIVKKLGLKKKDDIKMLGHLIDDHLETERIQETKDGSYKTNHVEEEITGVVDHVSSRFAYVKIGKDEPDIFIKGSDLGSAVDGDTVQIVIFPTRHGEHREGKVTKVIHRSRNRFVGKVEVSKNFAFVVPDARKVHGIFLSIPKILTALPRAIR
jgi:exoribonuclease R